MISFTIVFIVQLHIIFRDRRMWVSFLLLLTIATLPYSYCFQLY